MLSEQEAIANLIKLFPDRVPQKIITYNNFYLILAPGIDPDEGSWDPYFSVDMNTGEARDFSIFRDGKAREIDSLFQSAPEIEIERG